MRSPQVALLIPSSHHHGRGLIGGIGSFLQAHQAWRVSHHEPGIQDGGPACLSEWDGDGIISSWDHPGIGALAFERDVPLVDLGEGNHLSKKRKDPSISCDHSRAAELVAEDLLERGFKSFAYCQFGDSRPFRTLQRAFAQRLAEEGIEPVLLSLEAPPGRSEMAPPEATHDRLCEWIRSLPGPCAVMASCDSLGTRLIEACRREDRRVPEELAIVAVGNDPLICALSSPPLSSVDQDLEAIGFEAARLLTRLMKGEELIEQDWPILLPPRGIVTRASTETRAFEDAPLAAALAYIREQSASPIAVEEVSSHANLSRRELERHFQKVLSTTPNAEIQRARVKRIIKMLLFTGSTIEAISEALEFSDPANMTVLFKKITGTSPGDYRRKHQSTKWQFG